MIVTYCLAFIVACQFSGLALLLVMRYLELEPPYRGRRRYSWFGKHVVLPLAVRWDVRAGVLT